MSAQASIDVVMQLAGHEATAGRFGEVASEHILLALLKLAELPLQELGGIAPGAGVVERLTTEIQALRGELADRGIDSTHARRRLRAELGRGTAEHRHGPIHRSDAAKRAFDKSAKLAHKERASAMTAVHLLKALLANPTPAMVKVLGEDACKKDAKRGPSPLLDRYGKDLTELAKEGKLAAVENRQAETKALLEFLASSKKPAAFLVTDSNKLARDVVVATATAISGGNAAPSLKDCRILDISDTCRPDTAEGLARLQGILEEAAAFSSIVLLLPTITDLPPEANGWLTAMRTSIEQRQAKIICQESPDAYAALLAIDSAWKRFAQPIWLREQVGDEIPQEL
jgi:ATP-dependent Clp protease ATP-binding subunit ClpC